MVAGDIVPGVLESDAYFEPQNGTNRAEIASLTASADALIGNLELPLTDRGYPSDKPISWRSPPSVAKMLKAVGFHALSLANNHMMDFGVIGLQDTLAALAEAQIVAIGAGQDRQAALRPHVIQAQDGTRVAVLAICCTLPPGAAVGDQRPGVAPVRISTSYAVSPRIFDSPGVPPHVRTEAYPEDVDRLSQLVRDLKERTYIVLAYIHWGIGFTTLQAEYQRRLAIDLVEAGVDLIIGHHPHVLQGVELYDRVPVFYSISNFILHDSVISPAFSGIRQSLGETWILPSESIVPVLTFADHSLRAVEVQPIAIAPDGFPRLAERAEADCILDHLTELSRPFNTRWEVRGATTYLALK